MIVYIMCNSTRLIAASDAATILNPMNNLKYYLWIASTFIQIYIMILKYSLDGFCTLFHRK